MNDQQSRAAAVERIEAKRGFMVHAAIYVIVNIALVITWAVSSAGYFWPGWVIGGWGIGLVSHAIEVYVRHRPISEDRIRNEMTHQSKH